MTDLPGKWDAIPLRDVIETRKGKKPKDLRDKPVKDYVPYLDIAAIETGHIRQYADVESSRIGTPDDIFMVWDGARSGWVGFGLNGAIGSTIMALSPKKIDKKYLFYFLKMNFGGISTNHRGTGIPHVDPGYLWNIEVPYPSLEEQKQISKKLDNILPKIKDLQARLDKIPVLLKRFRQSVLSSACSGRLSHAASMSWQRVILGDVAEIQLGKMLDSAKNKGTPIGYLRNINVRWFTIEAERLAKIKATKDDRIKYSIRDGDLLLCEGGEPGRCAIWNQGNMELIFQKAIHRVRFSGDKVHPLWLAYNIKNDAESGKLEEYFTGTTIKHFPKESLTKYEFKLPSYSEQLTIISKVKKLLNMADDIEAKYTTARTRIDKLSQSILSKAFRGELI